MTKVKQLFEKLHRLREMDPGYQVFGASKHRYRLAPVLAESEVSTFEREFGVSLPDDFAAFLTQLGDGGAGPDYGLFSLGEAIERFRRVQALAGERGKLVPQLDREFPLTGAVADVLIACERQGRGLRRNFNPSVRTPFLLDGIIDICHRGCGNHVGLVLAGEQRGRVWGTSGEVAAVASVVSTSERGRARGPAGESWCAYGPGPGSLGFLAWYEEWLDRWLEPGAIERLRNLRRR